MFLLGTVSVSACTVPVYRYALEKWKADRYVAIVAYHEILDAEGQEQVRRLHENPAMKAYAVKAVNGVVRLPFASPIRLPAESPPRLFLYAPPDMQIDQPLWSADFTPDSANRLLETPLNHQLLERLTGDHSAVWLVLLSGEDEQGDAAVLDRLEGALTRVSDEINARGGEAEPVRFSVLAMRGAAEENTVLRNVLERLAPEVHAQGVPIVIPVFGRGRALRQISAVELTEDVIRDACFFLTAACSCQVKRMNPGVDLFLPVDWESAVSK